MGYLPEIILERDDLGNAAEDFVIQRKGFGLESELKFKMSTK